jgi:hypothetical protein
MVFGSEYDAKKDAATEEMSKEAALTPKKAALAARKETLRLVLMGLESEYHVSPPLKTLASWLGVGKSTVHRWISDDSEVSR